MPNQTDQQICDDVATKIMGFVKVTHNNEHVGWRTAEGGVPFSFIPCGPNANANDTERVKQRMRELGWAVSIDRWLSGQVCVYLNNDIVCGYNGQHSKVIEKDEGIALCLAALDVVAAKASEKKEDGNA